MPTVKVRNIQNEEIGEVELSDAVFGAPLNEGLIHAAVRNFMAAVLKDVDAAQWKVGFDVTQDAIECNTGNAAGCKLHTLVSRNPMKEVKPTQADKEVAAKVLSQTVLPSWVKRCGARCGEIYNEVVAPITKVRYTPQ